MIPFERDQVDVPTGVGRLSITFATQDASSPIEGAFTFQVLDDKGRVLKARHGELLRHLTDAQITSITNFLANLRTKATNDVTPTQV